jgi:hypothetical protein
MRTGYFSGPMALPAIRTKKIEFNVHHFREAWSWNNVNIFRQDAFAVSAWYVSVFIAVVRNDDKSFQIPKG